VAPLPGEVGAVLLRQERDAFVDALAATGLPTVDLDAGAVAPALARAGRVDVVLYGGGALEAAELLLAMRASGLAAPLWGGPALARRQLPQVAGDAAAGTCYAVTAATYADLTPGSGFWAEYAARAGQEPGPWAGLAYDAAAVLLDAVAAAIENDGVLTRERVRDQLSLVLDPDGRALFSGGRRAGSDVAWYCYGQGTPYPGQQQPW
jgi:ABC-type branched-subunit amino acid transport system substrate-binding protein